MRDWVKRALVLLVAVLFLSVAFLPIVNASMEESGVKLTMKLSAIDFTSAKLSLSLAAGAILSVIFAVFTASVPMRKRKQ